MNKHKFNFWLMVVVGTGAFVWLVAELIRVLFEVIDRSGLQAVLLDGVIQHKVGEIMVAAPLFIVALFGNKWTKEKLLGFVDRTKLIMIIGGLLNALAFYSLHERTPWNSFFRIWCLILFITGIFGSAIAKWLIAMNKARFTSKF